LTDGAICSYHTKTELSNGGVTYQYFCAQREGAQTKPKHHTDKPQKQRDRDYMDRHCCEGLLRITVDDIDRDIYRIVFKHALEHAHYTSITPDSEIKKYIEQNSNLAPSQVSDHTK